MRGVIFVFYFFFLKWCNGYNILGIFPLQSKSHFVMFERLFKGLAEKGHEVDVVSHFPLKKSFPRYNDLSILGTMPLFVNNLSVLAVRDLSKLDTMLFMINEGGVDACKALLTSPVAKTLKETTKKYDLLITEIFGTDCALGFAHLFKIPVISVTSSVDLPWGAARIGNPDNPSYIPNYYVPFTSQMSLSERIINTIVLIGAKIGYDAISMTKSNVLAREFFGPDLPDLQILASNTSLLLVNSYFSVNFARPLLPNFIEVGGLHIAESKPLPKHLQELIENEHHGVIYLSMGSMVLTETFEKEKLQAFFDALSELPYKVLWKAERKNMPEEVTIPENIHFKSWMPQLDILCHPNVKLFITHGGLMGTQEAIKCGVPRLGIPIFADQELNMRQSVLMGLAIKIPYHDITKKTILKAVTELLTNPKYKVNAQKASKLFKDRLTTPLETAIYWVEYVIRHKGAPHLQSAAAFLPWYQYYLVDVVIILLSATSIVIITSYILINRIIKVTSRKFKKKIKSL